MDISYTMNEFFGFKSELMNIFRLQNLIMRKIAVLLVLGLLIISSCGTKTGNQGTVTLKINPLFGTKIALNQTYTATDGKTYSFAEFKMYLAHIKLVHTDGSTIEVKSMAYVSLDDSTTMSMQFTVPNGSFKGIQFYIGLDSVQNALPVNQTDPTNPQYVNNSMTWGNPALEYVFVKLDGYTNANNQGSFEFHVGTNPYYTAVSTVSKNFTVSGGQTMLMLNTDVHGIFYNTTNPINISINNYTETSGPTDTLAHQFMNNISQVFSLQ